MKKVALLVTLLILCISAAKADIIFDHTISDATGYEHGIFSLNSESLLVTGAGAYQIDGHGDSYVEVENTAPLQDNTGGIFILSLIDFSILDYQDGETELLMIREDATATFSGGSIDYISSYQDSDITKHITFVCDVDSISFVDSMLTGDWLDGKGSFSIGLMNQPGYDSAYSNINFVPEPATMLLLSVGGLLIRNKK